MTIDTRMMPPIGAVSRMKLKIELVVERRVDRIREGSHKQGMPVRRRIDDRFGADVAAGSRPIVDQEGLPEPVGKPLPDQPRRDVDAASRGKRRDNPHRARGISLRAGQSRQHRQRGNARGEMQKFPAGKSHDVLGAIVPRPAWAEQPKYRLTARSGRRSL
jgi:hypothetical protein